MDKKKPKKKSASGDDTQFPGYPHYPKKEDIYEKEHKENLAGDDEDEDMGLIVPGSGLDNKDEEIGEEDEENNYYSLGGDEHNKLEEAPDE